MLPEGTQYEDNLYYCYELLWKYVQQATGVKIPLAYGSTESEHAIYFHEEPLDSELGEKLGYDGYIYKVENGNLHFYGAKRGNMYAVYEILEDYLGFLSGGCSKSPIDLLRGAGVDMASSAPVNEEDAYEEEYVEN